MKQLSVLIKAHPFLFSYLGVYALLQIGLIYHSGLRFAIPLLFLFFIPFLIIYSFLSRWSFSISSFELKIKNLDKYLFFLALLIVLIHFGWLGKIPFIDAWNASKLSEANIIRKSSSSGLPKWLHYASTWTIRALLPTTALFFLSKRKMSWFIFSVGLGCFYGLALLQKSLIFWIGFPVILYYFFNRKWWHGLLSTSIMIGLFLVAIFANNPQLHGGEHDLSPPQFEKKDRANMVSEGVFNRIFIIPGKTMSMWFTHVPKDKPFLYGRDFGLYARLIDQKAVDYNLELYAFFYPEYAKQGIKGSVNTAHFMRSYANFGWWGLPISAILLASFFGFLNNIYRKTNPNLAFSLQIFPLLLLSSGSLLTLLFSGGWGLILVLIMSSPSKDNLNV